MVRYCIEGYQLDPKAKQLITELSLSNTNDKGFSLVNGIIKYKNRVWLGSHKAAHEAVLLALHSSAMGGHSGFLATYHRIKKHFAWPHMKEDI